eukprot:XP_001709523.1 Hypothetical protein GL50803_39664 [Giardia lamblia ATCC 50803]
MDCTWKDSIQTTKVGKAPPDNLYNAKTHGFRRIAKASEVCTKNTTLLFRGQRSAVKC